MIDLVFILITIFFSWKIYQQEGGDRLIWYLVGILFLNTATILIRKPLILNPPMVLSFVLAFTCIVKEHLSEWDRFPLKKAFIFALFCLFLVGFFDDRLPFYLKLYRPISYFINSMFICCLSYLCIKDEEDWLKISRVLFISMIVMCVYGFFNHMIKFNPYNAIISDFTNEIDVSNSFQSSNARPRISSFTSNSIYYGYLISLVIIIFLYNYIKSPEKYISLKNFIFILALLFPNLYLANSRTPYVVFLLGVASLLTFSADLKGKAKYFALSILLFLLSLNIPVVKDRLWQISDIFSSNQQVGGSSIDMRMEQLDGALAYFDHNIFTGNGFFYIFETIGFNLDSDLNEADEDMWGFESYIFEIVIEQGLAGLMANIVLFTSILYWLFQQRKHSLEIMQTAALGIAIVICFLFFSISTATLSSWYISMLFLGICIKRIDLMKDLEPLEPLNPLEIDQDLSELH